MNYNFKDWKFKELKVWMDGGSITLNYVDQNNRIQTIEVIQNISKSYSKELSKIPGRIYINNMLLEKRSKKEPEVIEQLKTSIESQHDELHKQIVKEKIDWIESNEYVEMKPTLTKLSKKRRQYLINEGYEFQNEIKLKNIELKFNELRNKKIDIKEFEEWIYFNEKAIKEQYSDWVYDQLIILNYNEHVISDLAKIIEIDYYKLELFELQSTINSLIDLDIEEINDVNHDLYESVYDPYSRVRFGFKINDVVMGINYPFKHNKEFPKLSNTERNQIFKEKFKHPCKFLITLLEEVNSKCFKLVVKENMEDIDRNDYTERLYGTKNDILFCIDKQIIIINKELSNNKMKIYWL